jgi:predicted PurR-regulated permease PerM
MDDNKFKEKIIKLFSVVGVAAIIIIGFDKISQLTSFVLDILSPFLIGGLIAVLLNIPVKFFEKRVFKFKGKYAERLNRPLSLMISLILFIVLVSSIMLVIIPRIGETLKEITETLPPFINNLTNLIQEKIELKGDLAQRVEDIEKYSTSWQNLVSYITQTMESENKTNMFSSAFKIAKNVFGSLGTVFIGFIFGIYSLMQKEKISLFVQNCVKTFLSEDKLRKFRYITKLVHSNFVDFFFGQCLECFVVATLFTIITTIFGFKCSFIIGVAMAFLALIPYIGNFITCGLGILFTFALESPERALLFGILFAIVQTLDAYLIYPRVVGIKVKMPPILIFVSAILGNGLFGIVGMIIMIPITTTIYMLIKEKIKEKENANQENISQDVDKEKLIEEITNLIKEGNLKP